MLVLERKGDEVFCNGCKLTINAQASKGPGKEVVKVEGLEGSNGQKWISLARLKEGINNIETQGREIGSYQKYTLTQEEKEEIKMHQDAIDKIIEVAKSRFVAKPNFKLNPKKMTEEEREAEIAKFEAYLRMLRGE